MRQVCTPGREGHPEKASHHVRLIDRVTLPAPWTDQQLILNRTRVTLDSFLLHVVQIDDSRMLRGSAERAAGRDLEAHNQDSQSLTGIVGDQMLDTRSQVHEIIRA